VVGLVVLSAVLGAAAEDGPSREQEHVTRCSALMVQFADRLSAQHLARPPSWGWLDGALKQFCEHDDLQTGDAVEFCHFASGQVIERSKVIAEGRRQGPTPVSELAASCRHVGSQRWTAFERLNTETCNDFCVAQGLAPWRADDYVNTRKVPAYEDVCQNRKVVTASKQHVEKQHARTGIGGGLFIRWNTRAHALKLGMLYVYTPLEGTAHVSSRDNTQAARHGEDAEAPDQPHASALLLAHEAPSRSRCCASPAKDGGA